MNGNLGTAAEVLEQEVQERKTIPGPTGDEEYVAARFLYPALLIRGFFAVMAHNLVGR